MKVKLHAKFYGGLAVNRFQITWRGWGANEVYLSLKIKKSRQTYGNVREMKAFAVQIVFRMDT